MLRHKIIPLAWLFLACLIIGAAAGIGTARADEPGCIQQPWWRGEAMRWTTRTLCDTSIDADGSWIRARNFWGPRYYVPFRCGTYSCWGGYWVGEYDSGVETYVVTPATVLPDEPGHIA